VRGALEIYAARLAAERMSPDAAARLDAHLDDMVAHLDDLPAFVDADLQFHLELAHATGNSVLVDLLQIIRSLLRVWVDRAVHDVEHARVAIAEHTAVRDAIRSGDGDAAASAMSLHMVTAGRRLSEPARN
jgi:GntR family transcriptional repressor for pyruvate dehydrogenase complex